MRHLGLIPLRNFAVVDEKKQIYRAAQPMYFYEYKWLKDVLALSTIINLRRESRHDNQMCKSLGIQVINIDVVDHFPPTKEQCEEFSTLISEGKSFPLLFHCEHGHGRTSTFCVLSRLAMGWTLQDAIKEEKEKFHYSFHHPIQLEFLNKNFDHQNLAV